ncbi:MAG: hypothetical protein ACLGSA_12670 [Acidobacteriota bacterium]
MAKCKEVIEAALESVMGGPEEEGGLQLKHIHGIMLDVNLNQEGEVVPEETGIRVSVNMYPMRREEQK